VDRFPDEHGMFVVGEGLGEAVDGDLHPVGVDRGQDQREGGLAARAGGAERTGPFVAPILNARRGRRPHAHQR
jgi:hypothetical protein